jgi:predicted anti-sigma-YlaC factor YlaD
MSRRRTLVVALGLAVLVVWLTGAIPRWGQWYSNQPFYRAQVHAFFEGRLALSHEVEAVTHDLAYVDDGVQQVWGLGVPIWLSFWEALGRPFGLSPFPERIAMLFGIALVMYLLLRAWVGSSGDRTAASWGAFLLTAVVPGVYAMMRGRMVVYEEASAYAYGTAMLLVAGVIAMLRRPTTARYLLIVGFAGLTGLMRPTVWFYGGATAGVATLLYIQHRGSLRRAARVVAFGVALFVAGGGVLYLTNHVRFGRGTEFGHKLNLEDLPGNMYATRFEYPFQTVPLADAARELVGGLFGAPERKARPGYFFYDRKLHVMQSEHPRWREYYFATYRWVHLPLILLGIGLTAVCWLRVRRGEDPSVATTEQGVIAGPALARESRWLGLRR